MSLTLRIINWRVGRSHPNKRKYEQFDSTIIFSGNKLQLLQTVFRYSFYVKNLVSNNNENGVKFCHTHNFISVVRDLPIFDHDQDKILTQHLTCCTRSYSTPSSEALIILALIDRYLQYSINLQLLELTFNVKNLIR